MLLHQKNRADQICACSTRRTLDDHADGVKPFLATWGGEIIYFHQTTPELQKTLATLGRPAIVVIDLE